MSPTFRDLKFVVAVAVGLVLASLGAPAAGQVCGATCAEPEPPRVDCRSGCDRRLFGLGHHHVNVDEVACVPRGASLHGRVTMSGGELRVCGSATLRSLTLEAGDLTVLGRARLFSIEASENTSIENHGGMLVRHLGSRGSVENHGRMTVAGALNLATGSAFYNASSLVVARSVVNSGTFHNAGDLVVRGSLHNTGAGMLTNECSAAVDGDASFGGTADNTGLLAVAGTVDVNHELHLGPYSQVRSRDLRIEGTIAGQYNDCSSIVVDGSTIVNGSVEEKVDICDASGIESIDGTLGYQVTTDCSCDPTVAESLVLFDVQLADLARFECIDSLRALTIYESSFTDLSGFPDLPNLESLYLGSAGLTSLVGLPSLRNLNELSIEHNDLTNLDSMPSLPSLRTLFAGDNPIEDALGLSAAPALEWLDLYNTEIASIADVATLADLYTLLLDHDYKGPHEDWAYLELTNLEALANFPRLEWVDMSGRVLTDLVGFPVANDLLYLHLGNNELADLTGLPAQPALELVTLENNPLDYETVAIQATTLGLELCSYPELRLPGSCY